MPVICIYFGKIIIVTERLCLFLSCYLLSVYYAPDTVIGELYKLYPSTYVTPITSLLEMSNYTTKDEQTDSQCLSM